MRGSRALVIGLLAFGALVAGCGSEDADGRVSDSALVSTSREVVNDVVAGRYAEVRALFDETMKAQLSEQKMDEAWKQFVTLFGEFQRQGSAEVVKSGGFDVVNIALLMTKREGQARVTFDADGKIAGLFFLRTDVPVPP
jgi:hypothetical protein